MNLRLDQPHVKDLYPLCYSLVVVCTLLIMTVERETQLIFHHENLLSIWRTIYHPNSSIH